MQYHTNRQIGRGSGRTKRPAQSTAQIYAAILAVSLTSHHLAATPTTSPALIEPLIDVRRAAKLLGIREKTLRDWVWRKKIDYVKIGDRDMFEPEAIRDFIARNRVRANQRVM